MQVPAKISESESQKFLPLSSDFLSQVQPGCYVLKHKIIPGEAPESSSNRLQKFGNLILAKIFEINQELEEATKAGFTESKVLQRKRKLTNLSRAMSFVFEGFFPLELESEELQEIDNFIRDHGDQGQANDRSLNTPPIGVPDEDLAQIREFLVNWERELLAEYPEFGVALDPAAADSSHEMSLPQFIIPEMEVENLPQVIIPETKMENLPQVIIPETEMENLPQGIIPEMEVENLLQVIIPETEVENLPQVITPEMEVENLPQAVVPEIQEESHEDPPNQFYVQEPPVPDSPGDVIRPITTATPRYSIFDPSKIFGIPGARFEPMDMYSDDDDDDEDDIEVPCEVIDLISSDDESKEERGEEVQEPSKAPIASSSSMQKEKEQMQKPEEPHPRSRVDDDEVERLDPDSSEEEGKETQEEAHDQGSAFSQPPASPTSSVETETEEVQKRKVSHPRKMLYKKKGKGRPRRVGTRRSPRLLERDIGK